MIQAIRRCAVPGALALLISAGAPASSVTASDPVVLDVAMRAAYGDDDLARDLARIREVTEPFHDVDAARAAGYPHPVPDHCVESQAGGMGYHYVNQGLLDDQLDVEQPEILVYAPTGDGGLALAGVEYIVPYAAWERDEAPRILGQDLKRADDLQIWYLHVWVWEENSQGVFADWNPAVRCST